MKRKILIVLLVLVLSILIFGGALAKGGWTPNPEAYWWWWITGGDYLVVKQEAEIRWRDACVQTTSPIVDYCGDLVWLRDAEDVDECMEKYPDFFFRPEGADLTPFLGYDPPLWHDGFNVCGKTEETCFCPEE